MITCCTRLKCMWSCKCFPVRNRSIAMEKVVDQRFFFLLLHIPTPMTILSVGESESSGGGLPTTSALPIAILGLHRIHDQNKYGQDLPNATCSRSWLPRRQNQRQIVIGCRSPHTRFTCCRPDWSVFHFFFFVG